MSRFLQRRQGKAQATQTDDSDNSLKIRIESIALRLVDSISLKTLKGATVVIRLICHKRSVQTKSIVNATTIVWRPEVAFEFPMSDLAVEVILKRPFFRSDSKIGNFLVTASDVASSERDGRCEKRLRSTLGTLEVNISLSSFPSVVDHAAHADPLQGLAGIETGIVSTKGTLYCFAECAGYLNGVLGHVEDVDDIQSISKAAAGTLMKVQHLVDKQDDHDDNVQILASCMRDMLESLSALKDLGKIEIVRSVIKLAVTRAHECAQFIDEHAPHGFWVRQSLSSDIADIMEEFKSTFTGMKDIFEYVVSPQALNDVMQNLGDVGDRLVDIDLLAEIPRCRGVVYDPSIGCLPGTRKDILSAIYNWIDILDPGHNVFWLRGAAGSGKTTIASTIAAELDKEYGQRLGLGSLGASLFSRPHDGHVYHPHLVIPTLAFHLALAFPFLKRFILSAMRKNANVFDSPIENQFQELIVGPLSKVAPSRVMAPVVCVIDALDECGDALTREPLLRCLKDVRRLPSWFKVLVTSRPEPDIAKHLADLSFGLEIDTNSEQTRLDIRTYTQACLEQLRIERCLGSDWPGELLVDQLCSRAEGLFIWTTLSFCAMSREPDPTNALERVLATTYTFSQRKQARSFVRIAW